MEYLNFLDLGVGYLPIFECRPDHTLKNQLLLCQRSNFNEWAQSAYLLVPNGDGIPLYPPLMHGLYLLYGSVVARKNGRW